MQIGGRENAPRNRRTLDVVPGQRLRVVSMATQLDDRAEVRRRECRGGGVQILTSLVRFVVDVFTLIVHGENEVSVEGSVE